QLGVDAQTGIAVAESGSPRLPARGTRRDDLVDGPPFRVSRELAGSAGIDEKATRRLGLRQQQVATVEPVGVDQALRLFALEAVRTAEQRLDALRPHLREPLERLRTRPGP